MPKRVLGKFMHVTNEPLKMKDNKTIVFFMGAGFCPFCAAERWAIIAALQNFGKWEGLIQTTSADHDEKYLNISTASFARAKYVSDHFVFIGRETSDRNFEPLQELDEHDYQILDVFNPDQIIPFLLIDGQFMQVGSGYSPSVLEGMDHAKIRGEIADPGSPVGKAMKTEIDNITALICKCIQGRHKICDTENIKNSVGRI